VQWCLSWHLGLVHVRCYWHNGSDQAGLCESQHVLASVVVLSTLCRPIKSPGPWASGFLSEHTVGYCHSTADNL